MGDLLVKEKRKLIVVGKTRRTHEARSWRPSHDVSCCRTRSPPHYFSWEHHTVIEINLASLFYVMRQSQPMAFGVDNTCFFQLAETCRRVSGFPRIVFAITPVVMSTLTTKATRTMSENQNSMTNSSKRRQAKKSMHQTIVPSYRALMVCDSPQQMRLAGRGDTTAPLEAVHGPL